MSYKTECHQCAGGSGLQMVPHRNKFGGVIGIVFVCEKCFPNIAGCEVETRVKEKAEESPADSPASPVQQHEYAFSRLKELRNQAVSFMGRNIPIGSAYVYDVVNEALTIIGEKQHTS